MLPNFRIFFAIILLTLVAGCTSTPSKENLQKAYKSMQDEVKQMSSEGYDVSDAEAKMAKLENLINSNQLSEAARLMGEIQLPEARLKTCAERKGNICNTDQKYQSCNGKSLRASDTEFCCDVSCTSSLEKNKESLLDNYKQLKMEFDVKPKSYGLKGVDKDLERLKELIDGENFDAAFDLSNKIMNTIYSSNLRTCAENNGVICNPNISDATCYGNYIPSKDTEFCCDNSCDSKCKDVSCPAGQKCVNGTCEKRTCSGAGGVVCNPNVGDGYCQGNYIDATDTEFCCSVVCKKDEVPQTGNVPEVGSMPETGDVPVVETPTNSCPAGKTYRDGVCWTNDECQADADCDDGDVSTSDKCYDGTPKVCSNSLIQKCASGDNYCPSGCAYYNDGDCEYKDECAEKTGNERDLCYLNIAGNSKNASLCANISSQIWRDDCYRVVGQSLNDLKICDNINGTNTDTQCTCRARIAANLKDATICSNLKSLQTKFNGPCSDECYYLVAVAKNDPGLCILSGGTFKEECEDYFK